MKTVAGAAGAIGFTAATTYAAAVHPKLQAACVLAAVALAAWLCVRRADELNKPRAEGVQRSERVVR